MVSKFARRNSGNTLKHQTGYKDSGQRHEPSILWVKSDINRFAFPESTSATRVPGWSLRVSQTLSLLFSPFINIISFKANYTADMTLHRTHLILLF
jgi:hypothetical protein